jgi:hypothetical protein
MSRGEGAYTWFVPDGYLPKKGHGKLEGHEALMILNTGHKEAHVKLDIYFEDKAPVRDIPVKVGAERIKCLRMDNPEHLNGLKIPILTQYAIRIRSNQKVIVQFGRLDVTQPNLAYYCTMAYPEMVSKGKK